MNKEGYLESESLSHLTYLLHRLKTKEGWKDFNANLYFHSDTGSWHADYKVTKSKLVFKSQYHRMVEKLRQTYEVVETPSSVAIVDVGIDVPCKVALTLHDPKECVYLVQLIEEPFQGVSSMLVTSDWKEVEERLSIYNTASRIRAIKDIFTSNDYELVEGWDEDIQEFKAMVSKERLNEVKKTVLSESTLL